MSSMKSIKSLIYLLGMILLYSYIVFFFKVFRVEKSFNYFHLTLLLVCNICIAIMSYYPIHLKRMSISPYLTFFTSLSYIGFLLSSILCIIQAYGTNYCPLQRKSIYLINFCILLILLLLSFIATAIILRYPKSSKYLLAGFFSIVTLQHLALLYTNLFFDVSSFYNLFVQIKVPLMFIVVILHTVALLALYWDFKMFSQKHNITLPTELTPLIGAYILLFILSSHILWDCTPLFVNFILICTCLLIVYLVGKVTLHLITPDHDTYLSTYRQNNQLMNAYYKRLSHTQTQLSERLHHMDSIHKQMLAFYPDAFFVLLDFNICDTNEFGMKLLETTNKDQLIGEEFLNYVAPPYHSKLRKLIQKLSVQTKTTVTSDFELLTPSGKTLYVEGSFMMTDLYNHPSILVSIRDLSFHKEAYELQRQIEMEKLKVEFFSTISHELKTPVNIIYSATQLQATLIRNNQTENLDTYTQMINHNCLRLLRLLNNLLDISRLESNYFTVKAEHFNIVSLSESILESIIPYANRKSITPIFDTEFEEIYCYLDPELLERILLNLLSNAVKYGKEQGTIEMTLKCSPNQVHIHIKDDGVGIPQEKLDSIFHRFMRVENGLIRNAEGSGIGLSLVKSLVEKQNGSIDVLSEIDVGSEFIVTFPRVSPIEPLLSYTHPEMNTSKIDLEFSDVFQD